MVSVLVAAVASCTRMRRIHLPCKSISEAFVYAALGNKHRETVLSRGEVVERAALSPTFDDGVLERQPEATRTYKCIDILHCNGYAVLSQLAMRFTWDENKNRQNLRKHDVRFETAVLVFDDPYAITQRDVTFEDEERWITVGAIGPGSILLVVHTFYEEHDEEVIRVISARAAESHERRAYEEAHKRAEARHPSHRGKKRRRH
jgi:uncharacterized DUF497 family protein